jgi:putative nucleotidyltransferase with HDIG domain
MLETPAPAVVDPHAAAVSEPEPPILLAPEPDAADQAKDDEPTPQPNLPEPSAMPPESPPPTRATNGTRPLRARISLLESLNLTDFQIAAGGIHHPESSHPSPQASAKVAAQAAKIGLRLRARAPILEGLSRAAPDPLELGQMIIDDRALAAQLLKTVNSPYYGLMHPAESVFQAVQLLGLIEIRSIVWRTCINEAFEGVDRPATELMGELWRHAFAITRVAQAMARSVNLPRTGEVSRAALLHDIGKFIALSVWPGWAQTFYTPLRFSNRDRLGLEKDYMGTDHARLGAEVVRAWGLPTELCMTIEQHHAPIFYAPGRVTGNRRAIAVVHLSDLLCHIADPYLAGREMLPAHLPVAGWMSVLGVRDNLEAICTAEVVQALLPPSIDRRHSFPLSA